MKNGLVSETNIHHHAHTAEHETPPPLSPEPRHPDWFQTGYHILPEDRMMNTTWSKK
jgi:hypothetical protein